MTHLPLTDHARKRMDQRGISPNLVDLTVSYGREIHYRKAVYYFIGDKESDILAGRSHGCIPLLIKTGGYGEKVFGSLNSPPKEHCFDNLMGAVEFILKTSDENS